MIKLLYLKYWDITNLCGWPIPQNLPVGNFIWVKNTSKSNNHFMKNYNEVSGAGYVFEADVQYLEKNNGLHKIYRFYRKE